MTTPIIKAVFLMADYGHDPTETAVPFTTFQSANYSITIATQDGKVPKCDERMLSGWTQTFLGADKHTISLYNSMTTAQPWQTPVSYKDSSFSLTSYDLVFLPGGHDKDIRQLLDDPRAQQLLVEYFPLTLRQTSAGNSPKFCGAICHGVQMLAQSKDKTGVSVLSEVETTCLPAVFESSVFSMTKLFLGDYYKTYGAGTDNVEAIVRKSLKDDQSQFKGSANVASPFVVEDKKYAYFSGRWPGDAQALADRIVEAVGASRK